MSAIKNFFTKKKLDFKFKKAGKGHLLTEQVAAPDAPVREKIERSEPTNAEISAGNAAIARLQNKNKPIVVTPRVNISKNSGSSSTGQSTTQSGTSECVSDLSLNEAPVASEYVKFNCELFEGAYELSEVNAKIEEYLLSQLATEPVMASALIIQTLNRSTERIQTCIDILVKYIDNITSSPGERKFRSIRINNKTFQEKANSVRGTHEFLQSAGFMIREQPGNNTEQLEDFYVYENPDTESLLRSKEILLIAEPITANLDRCVHVFHPSEKITRIDIPQCFYNLSINDIKKEQAIKREAIEKLGMLRTKEMRERERTQALRKYRYTLIRVRFPDNIIVQATFRSNEKIQALNEFVIECLKYDFVPFTLSNLQTRQQITNTTLSLAEAELAPASVVLCNFDQAILNEISSQRKDFNLKNYVKKELMNTIETL